MKAIGPTFSVLAALLLALAARAGEPDGPAASVAADEVALPPGALARFGAVRFRSHQPVRDVAYSPDGQRLATVGDAGAVHIWDAASGRRLRTVRRLGDSLGSGAERVRWSADGRYLATATRTEIQIWSLPAAELYHVVRASGPLAFSPAGDRLAYGKGRQVELLHLASRRVVRSLSAGEYGLYQMGPLSFSADGRLLATTWWQGFAVWRVADGLPLAVHHEKHGDFSCIALAPDGALAAVGEFRRSRVRLWDLGAEQPLAPVIRGPSAHKPLAAAFAPGGRRLLLRWWLNYKDQSQVHVWRLAADRGDAPERLLVVPEAAAFALAPEGGRLATASGRTLRFWDAAAGRPLRPPRGHGGAVRRLSLAARSRYLLSSGAAGAFFLWDLQQRCGRLIHSGLGDAGATGAISADGQLLALRSSFAAEEGHLAEAIRIQRRGASRVLADLDPYPQLRHPVFAAGGARLYSHTRQGDVLIHEPRSGALVRYLPLGVAERGIDARPPAIIGISPGGRHFVRAEQASQRSVSARRGARLGVWRLPAGTRAGRIALETNRELRCAFAHSHHWLACSATGAPLRLFDLEGGGLLLETDCGLARVTALAFSPEDRRLAVAGRPAAKAPPRLLLLDAASGGLAESIPALPAPVTALRFMPGARRLISGHADGDILVWDLDRVAATTPPTPPARP